MSWLYRKNQNIAFAYRFPIVRRDRNIAIFFKFRNGPHVSFGQVHAGSTVAVQNSFGYGKAQIASSYDRYFHFPFFRCSLLVVRC